MHFKFQKVSEFYLNINICDQTETDTFRSDIFTETCNCLIDEDLKLKTIVIVLKSFEP